MRLRKRALAIGLLIAAALSSLNAAGTAQRPAATAPGDAPLVRVLSGGWLGTDYNAVESKRVFEERTDTRIEMITVSWGELAQRRQAMIASGDYPDIVAIGDTEEMQFVGAGILVPISDHFAQYTNIRDYLSPGEWDVLRHADGSIYAVPSTTYGEFDPRTGERLRTLNAKAIIYRADWLEKFGLSIPTTLAEYLEVARAVSLRDPNGTGRQDTYAFGGQGGISHHFNHIFGAYGTVPLIWFERDGRVVQGSVLPEAKEALRFINGMWREGLIDPEFFTDDAARNLDKRIGGVFGAPYIVNANLADPNDPFTRRFNERNPDGRYVIGEPIAGPGTRGTPVQGVLENTRGWTRSAVTRQSRNVDAALRLIDYVVSPEGMWFYNFGIEGEHHRILPDGSVDLFLSDEVRASFGITFAYSPPVVPTFIQLHHSPEYRRQLAPWQTYKIRAATDMLIVPEIGRYGSLLNDFITDEFVKMIVGQTPIDGGFERFVAEWERRGGRETYEALNAALQARQ